MSGFGSKACWLASVPDLRVVGMAALDRSSMKSLTMKSLLCRNQLVLGVPAGGSLPRTYPE
jgi:hypothetical protein